MARELRDLDDVPAAVADIGLAFAYGFYTFFAVLSFFFVAKFVKETKGRQLEDM